MNNLLKTLGIAFFTMLTTTTSAFSCDVCAIYSAVGIKDISTSKWSVGIQEQYTNFEGSIGGIKQTLDSSITQASVAYSMNDRLAVQITLPYINRDYKRLENGHLRNGSESGIGDMSALVNYQALAIRESDNSTFLNFFAGLELPTGDSDRLREESQEEEEDSEIELNDHKALFRHGGAEGNLVTGSDLALGSGSIDFILGSSFFRQIDSYFLAAAMQYAINAEGDHNFEYGNSLNWNFGPGIYFYNGNESSTSLAINLAGEHRAKDKLNDNKLPDSIDRIYLGPALNYVTDNNWDFEIGIDFPIKKGDKDKMVEPDLRIRASVLKRF